MDWLKKLSLGDRLVAGGGVLLLVDLLFLPWHHIEVGFGAFTATANRTAVESPDALFGWLAALLALAMVVHVVIVRFTTVELPKLAVPWDQVSLYGGIATLAMLVLKLLAETSYLGFGAWLGLALGGVVAYGGFLHAREHFGTAGQAGRPPILGT